MNESKRIAIQNRETFLIGQNSLKEEGREEGYEEGRIETAKRMIKNKRPLQYIIEDTGFTEDEIKGFQSELEEN